MGPFSLTGQPNAMGGREVGGLANQLAAHMGFEAENVDRVRRFWNASAPADKEGLKAVDLFDAVAAGRIKALWVMGTNPAVSLPRADAVRSALGNARSSSSCRRWSPPTIRSGRGRTCCCRRRPGGRRTAPSPTPSAASRASARSSSRPAKPSRTGGSSPQVGKRLGFAKAFDYRVSGRHLPRARATLGLRERRHARFRFERARRHIARRLQGPCTRAVARPRCAHWPASRGSLPMALLHAEPAARSFVLGCQAGVGSWTNPASSYPFLLNTGRVRDHWHTMTRTGNHRVSARTSRSRSSRCIPTTPAAAGLLDGGLRARSPRCMAACVLRVRCQRGPAPRRGVRANPLERRDGVGCAHRRPRASGMRSPFRPARHEGDAGEDRAGAFSPLQGFLPVAPKRCRCPRISGGRARPSRAAAAYRFAANALGRSLERV